MTSSSVSPAVAGLGVGVSFILIFAMFAAKQQEPGEARQAISPVSDDIVKCSQYGEWAAILDEGGFVAIKPVHDAAQLKAGTETPGRKPGMYQFVLAPNSTGYITMVYDSCSQQSPIDVSNSSAFFESFDTRTTGIYKFDSNVKSDSYQSGQATWIPTNLTGGIMIYPSDIHVENGHRFIVTYTVRAEPTAGTGLYIMTLYHTCPGELLTIGNEPHEGEIPWVSGTFYGCSF